jgi:hypothetical protein
MRHRVTTVRQNTIARSLVTIARSLITIARSLITIGASLITIGGTLLAVSGRLIDHFAHSLEVCSGATRRRDEHNLVIVSVTLGRRSLSHERSPQWLSGRSRRARANPSDYSSLPRASSGPAMARSRRRVRSCPRPRAADHAAAAYPGAVDCVSAHASRPAGRDRLRRSTRSPNSAPRTVRRRCPTSRRARFDSTRSARLDGSFRWSEARSGSITPAGPLSDW